MRGRLSQTGYTVVEVLVFLAVSGMMFAVAANLVNGKQAKSEFRQGMNDLNSQIKQVINDVGTGFYPSNSDFICRVNGAGKTQAQAGRSVTQGSNDQCVFLGKVIQFNIISRGHPQPDTMSIYTIAGRRVAGGASRAPENFQEAGATVIGVGGVTETKKLPWGLIVDSIKEKKTNTSLEGIGLFGSFGDYSSGGLASGSQSINTIAIPLAPAVGERGRPTAINTALDGTYLDAILQANPNPQIEICLDSGVGEFGKLSVGSIYSQRLSTYVKIGPDRASIGC
jgi:hypothetical protein